MPGATPIVTFKMKRRTSGATGAPSALLAGELAYNEVDNVIYAGYGDDGSGNATSFKAVAGHGAFITLSGTQTIAGSKTFSSNVALGALATVTAPSQSDVSASVVSSSWVKSQNYLTANQAITVSGDITGSGATSIALTLPAITTAATYPKVTYNAKGQVTGGSALAASDIPTLTHTIISDFDASVRASRLDQMAVPTAAVSMNNQFLTSVPMPTNPDHAANKQYVDTAIQGLTPKPTATVATTAALPANTYGNGSLGYGATLTANSPGILTIDGYQTRLNDLVLVKNEASPANNGLYVVTTQGSATVAYVLTRHADMDTSVEYTGAFIPVGNAGTQNANTLWLANPSGNVVVGTTAIPFTQLNASTQIIQGNGISVSGTTVSVASANAARLAVSSAGVDLASGVIASPGTYKSVTVDTYGRVTAASNPTTLAGFGITDAQPLSANLTALGGLSASADQIGYFTGAGAMALAAFTSFGRQLIAAAGASAVGALLGLGTMASQNANAVAITGGTIDNVILDGGTF